MEQIRQKNIETIKGELSLLVKNSLDKGSDVRVFVFGSLANGDYIGTSDVDVLIVYGKNKEDILKLVSNLRDFRVDQDIITLTVEEFNSRDCSTLFWQKFGKERELIYG